MAYKLLRVLRANDVRRSLAADELARGKALLRQGGLGAAEQALRRATDLDPDNAEAHVRLGNCLSGQQRWAEAAALLQGYRDRFVDEPAVRAQLGAVLAEMGDAHAAVRELEAVADLPGADPRWLRWYAGALVKAGAREQALAAVGRLVTLAPEDPKALQTAALVSLEYGLAEQAITHLEAALAREPSGERLLWLSRALVQADRPEEALEKARAAVQAEPGRDSAHAALAEALLALGRVDEAHEAATTALRLGRPGHLHWHLLLARVHDAALAFERSRQLLLGVVRERPDEAETLRAVAGYFAGTGDVQQALALARQLIEILPEPRSYVLLGDYLHRLKRFDESLAALARAIELDPADAGAMATMASVLVQQCRVPEAVERLEAALALRPDRVKWRLKAASLLLELGELARAESHLWWILKDRPDDPTAQERLARVLLAQGRSEEAEAFVAHETHEPRPAWLAFQGYLAAGQHEHAFSYLAGRHRQILREVAAPGAAP